MKYNRLGFGVIQIVAVLFIGAMVAMAAVPKYKVYIAKAKMAEAFTLASDTRKKLTEFYIINNRFPRTDAEAEAMKTEAFSPPEYVREIVVNHRDKVHDIVIEIYMKDGVLSNEAGEIQFVYVAGNKSTISGSQVQWSCGAVGIDLELLPERCQE